MPHKPVLLQETLECLNLRPGSIAVDGTLGSGGHATEILKRIGETGRLLGLDQDPASIQSAREIFEGYSNVSLHAENFSDFEKVLDALNISSVDAVLLDVGFSSDQIEDADRGFSFERPGPLDMRMNPKINFTAADLVNTLSEKELKDLFWRYGNERWSGRIAASLCRQRSTRRIETTQDLAGIIEKALPYRGRYASSGKKRPHPATRVFQALRIAVNDELNVLQESLPRIWKRIAKGGRFAVLSFHSLEDRIVKGQFRSWRQNKEGLPTTKKPITPSLEERQNNPRSRSAKLRAIEKIV